MAAAIEIIKLILKCHGLNTPVGLETARFFPVHNSRNENELGPAL